MLTHETKTEAREQITFTGTLSKSFDLLKNNYQELLKALCIYLIVSWPLSVATQFLFRLMSEGRVTWWLLVPTVPVYLATIAFNVYVNIWPIYIFVKGRRPGVGEAFKLAVTSLLLSLLTGIGFLLFIVPGIYWLIKYRFVMLLVAEKDMSISEAFEESARLTEGNKITLFFYDLGKSFLAGILSNIIIIPVILIGIFEALFNALAGVQYRMTDEALFLFFSILTMVFNLSLYQQLRTGNDFSVKLGKKVMWIFVLIVCAIVIPLVALFAGIMIFATKESIKLHNQNKIEITNTASKIEEYYAKNGSYPKSLNELDSSYKKLFYETDGKTYRVCTNQKEDAYCFPETK